MYSTLEIIPDKSRVKGSKGYIHARQKYGIVPGGATTPQNVLNTTKMNGFQRAAKLIDGDRA